MAIREGGPRDSAKACYQDCPARVLLALLMEMHPSDPNLDYEVMRRLGAFDHDPFDRGEDDATDDG